MCSIYRKCSGMFSTMQCIHPAPSPLCFPRQPPLFPPFTLANLSASYIYVQSCFWQGCLSGQTWALKVYSSAAASPWLLPLLVLAFYQTPFCTAATFSHDFCTFLTKFVFCEFSLNSSFEEYIWTTFCPVQVYSFVCKWDDCMSWSSFVYFWASFSWAAVGAIIPNKARKDFLTVTDSSVFCLPPSSSPLALRSSLSYPAHSQ